MSRDRLSASLRVAHRWDGEPARPDEIVDVAFAADPHALVIEVDAPYHGDPAPPGPPGRVDGLWEFEVVELFLVGPRARYIEVELGPHGHYLALALEGIRRATRVDLAVDFRATIRGRRWHGEARLARGELPEPIERVNAFAVHGSGGARRYLAAFATAGDRPDFHRIGDYPRLRDLI